MSLFVQWYTSNANDSNIVIRFLVSTYYDKFQTRNDRVLLCSKIRGNSSMAMDQQSTHSRKSNILRSMVQHITVISMKQQT